MEKQENSYKNKKLYAKKPQDSVALLSHCAVRYPAIASTKQHAQGYWVGGGWSGAHRLGPGQRPVAVQANAPVARAHRRAAVPGGGHALEAHLLGEVVPRGVLQRHGGGGVHHALRRARVPAADAVLVQAHEGVAALISKSPPEATVRAEVSSRIKTGILTSLQQKGREVVFVMLNPRRCTHGLRRRGLKRRLGCAHEFVLTR